VITPGVLGADIVHGGKVLVCTSLIGPPLSEALLVAPETVAPLSVLCGTAPLLVGGSTLAPASEAVDVE
jgi:hypothetical protein